jgi:copper chaperone
MPHRELMLTQADTEHSYKFDVKVMLTCHHHNLRPNVQSQMTCGGCSGAVTRALKKAQDNGTGSEYGVMLRPDTAHFESVSSFDVSLEKQEVLVTGSIPYDDVMGVIKKTGKEVGS